MPYAVEYEVPGDARLYEQVNAAIGDEVPDGLQLHLVVASPTGLRHIEVWDDAETQERFDRERVGPAVASVLRSLGIADPPTLAPRAVLDIVDLRLVP